MSLNRRAIHLALLKLAKLLQSDELTPIYVSEPKGEAIRETESTYKQASLFKASDAH